MIDYLQKGLLLLAVVAVAGCFGGGSQGDGDLVATIGSKVLARNWQLSDRLQLNFAEDPTQAEFYGAVGGGLEEFPAASTRASTLRITALGAPREAD